VKIEDLNKVLALGMQAVATYRNLRDQLRAVQPDAQGLVDDAELIQMLGAEAKALEDHAAAVLQKHGGAA
jgi:hypothetical protein